MGRLRQAQLASKRGKSTLKEISGKSAASLLKSDLSRRRKG